MKKEQTSLIVKLAKKIRNDNASKSATIKSLSSAGIVTKNGRMTKNFPHLKRVLSTAE